MSFSSSNRPPAAGARAAKSAGPARRLPGGRERRPALAALAVILILLGAAGSALIALRSGDRQYFVAVKDNLPPGHKIEPEDLTRGDLAGKTGQLMLWSDRDKVEGWYTTSWIYAGQFVTQKNFVADPIPEGGALVGVSLESGRAPAEPINKGDIVRLIRVPAANQDSAEASVIASAAEVTAVNGTSLTDSKSGVNTTVNVTVLVPTGRSTTVAAAAAAKTLVLVKLSPATKPDVSMNKPGAR